jgi:hypothetical protein
VIVVTLSFAVCWLPIHILEVMKCANSSLLNTLIQSYPKVLYTIRAFTHALAYFNSCLNPYLYALLNRNFCYDLVDIIPSWRPCCKHSDTLESDHYDHCIKLPKTILSPNQILRSRKPLDDEEDDEIDYLEQNKTTNDVSCQVELLGIKTSKLT